MNTALLIRIFWMKNLESNKFLLIPRGDKEKGNMRKSIEELTREKGGIRLDIGGGANPNPGFINMDARDLPQVDVVWDVLKFPWPFSEESVILATASHLLEHIPPFQADPKLLGLLELLLKKGVITPYEQAEYIGTYNSKPQFIAFMDEVWRVMKVGGQFAISVPHGRSEGFLQDPSHCNAMNEARWSYFDPFCPRGSLWYIYRPMPWKLKHLSWEPSANMEVVLEKRSAAEVENV